MTESIIRRSAGATSYVGPDAVELYRVALLRASIEMHRSTGIIPARGIGITKLFRMAGAVTGKTYRRKDHERAVADLTQWIEAMKAAIPVEREGEDR